jgi:plastocyanin
MILPSGWGGCAERHLPANGRRLTVCALAAGAIATLLGTVALAGCGGSSGASASTAGPGATGTSMANSPHHRRRTRALKLAADPTGRLRYLPSVLRTRSDDVSIRFVNHSPLPHNLTLATSRGVVLGATPTFRGGTRTLTLELKPGRYTFYCTIPGHRTGGMQGTLTVR